MPLALFALERPRETRFHPITSQVKARVRYLPDSFLWHPLRLLRAHLDLVVRHPRHYADVLRFLWRRPEAGRWPNLLQAGYLACRLQKLGITHLHAHYASTPAGVAELAHLLTGIPYSISAHAKDIYLSAPEVLKRKMQRARFVITCTEYNRQVLSALSANGVPVHRMYHGLETQRFQPADEPVASAPAPRPTLLSVGRLREKKGFPCLLQACHLLKTKGYRFRCQIVGYGPQQAHLEQLIATLDLGDTVVMLGRLTHDKLLELYRQATLFVLPCQIAEDGDRDGIPNVLIEAMAMQLPVVSTAVSAIPELVEHERNGLLVPPQHPQALADALARLLEHPSLRQELGKAGRQKICQQFSLHQNVAAIRTLFTDAHHGEPTHAVSVQA
jgi:glycosyltransferase involved in cell wall biosynthesis